MRAGSCVLRLVAMAVVCAGCGRADATSLHSRTAMDHGLRTGTRMDATLLHCLTGGNRTLAAPQQTQIVTFATPFDCSACTRHLAGVPKVVKERGLSDHAFLVVWSPRIRSLERDLGPSRPLPICVNRDGSLWERYNLLHTPFTAVIRNGQVVYINDGTLLSRRTQIEFARDLQRVFGGS